MPSNYRNIKETLYNIDPDNHTTFEKLKFWLSNHLRIVWSLVMMLVLGIFCLWAALKVGTNTAGDTVIETLIPVKKAMEPEKLLNRNLPSNPAAPGGE